MKGRKGFTLLELMIVVTIIGILLAVAIPNFVSAKDRASFTACMKALGNYRDSAAQYFAEVDDYSTILADPRPQIGPFFMASFVAGTMEDEIDKTINVSCNDVGGGDWSAANGWNHVIGEADFCLLAESQGRAMPELGGAKPIMYVGNTGSCPIGLKQAIEAKSNPTFCPLQGALLGNSNCF